MGIPISTIGLKISWAVETTAGARPTTGYKVIHNLKEFPDTNPSPNTQDATTFDNLVNTSYVNLLTDLGGALTITANLNNELIEEWGELVSAYETASKSGKSVWMCVDIPKIDTAFYYPIEPAKIRLSGVTANALAEQSLYITVVDDAEEGEKPTYAEATAMNESGDTEAQEQSKAGA